MKNLWEIKQLLEKKKYVLSIKEYLILLENMDFINYLSYRASENFFVINLKNGEEYIFRLEKEQ